MLLVELIKCIEKVIFLIYSVYDHMIMNDLH